MFTKYISSKNKNKFLIDISILITQHGFEYEVTNKYFSLESALNRCLLRHNTVFFYESQPKFQRNISPISSGTKSSQTRNYLKSIIFWDVTPCSLFQKMILFITTAVRTSNITRNNLLPASWWFLAWLALRP
jgi:hypothetical protein